MNLIAKIRDARGLDASEKSVLFALASRCGPGKAAAWPSVPRLADDSGLSVRTTQRVLRKLAQAGWLRVQFNKHGKKNAPNNYFLTPPLSSGVIATPPSVTVTPPLVSQ